MTDPEPSAGLTQPDLIGDEDQASADGAATTETDGPDPEGTPVAEQARPDAGTDEDGPDLAEGRS